MVGDPVLALDIGGTKMAAALVDVDAGQVDAGRVLTRTTVPTPTGQDGPATFAPLAQAITALVRGTPGLRAIGVASAGPLRLPGHISPINIGAWRDFPVAAATLQAVQAAGVPAAPLTLMGDVHAFAFGEYLHGHRPAGHTPGAMIGAVISTGIGAAVISQGTAVLGATGNAGNLGHTSVHFTGPRCWCGGRGCVEGYASGPSMVRRAQQWGWRTGQSPTARNLTDDAAAGDPLALRAIDEGMHALAAGLTALATTCDATDIVLGGGVTRAGATILDPLRGHLADFIGLSHISAVSARIATVEDAALRGAAAWATHSSDWAFF